MAAREMISVETVVQAVAPGGAAGDATGGAAADAVGGGMIAAASTDLQPPPLLLRQQHRVSEGTTIRGLLGGAAGLSEVLEGIENGRLGLSVYGKRAWLDDILVDGSRIEVVAPIQADAKAARVARAAADRGRRRSRLSSGR